MKTVLAPAALALLLAACNQPEMPTAEPDAASAEVPSPAVAPDGAPSGPQSFQGRPPRDPFERLDANKDNILTADEIANASERGKGMLERADTDGDGKVSRAEIEVAMAERMKQFDRNGDGVISDDERPFRRPE